jgi:predicted nucleic acid-binding protein
MRRFVLDAWALLALLQEEEPAASRVKHLLEEAQVERVRLLISAINLGEAYYRVGKVKGEREARKTLDTLRRLSLSVISATDERVFAAADLKIHYTISYADAFAAATADEFGATLVTGDPELLALHNQLQIEELTRQHG